ncbi:MAG: pseudouridine synthase [Kangiellaceae bacterium]|nr:pseudouridine synthase [Kangiellaceae bacterium]
MRSKTSKSKSGSGKLRASKSRPAKQNGPNRENRNSQLQRRTGKLKTPHQPVPSDTGPKKLVLFNKPFNTLCQFTGEPADDTLANYIDIPNVYAAGRLDKDSEGLLLLTNDGKLQNRLSHPKFDKKKTYWVQVEGNIDQSALQALSQGVELKEGMTKPALAEVLDPTLGPDQLWQRTPPVRFRKNVPTSWISLTITEGKNRQVRRMTAAVGFPTLRLVRICIDTWKLDDLKPGEYRVINL